MLASMGIAASAGVDPVFTEVAKSLFGDDADIRALWDLSKSMPDTSDVSTVGAPATKKKKGIAAGLVLGTAAEGTATTKAAQEAFPNAAARATRAAEPVTRILKPVLTKIPKLPEGGAGKAHFALQATNLGVGLLAAHELIRKPKKPKLTAPGDAPVVKALRPIRLRKVPPTGQSGGALPFREVADRTKERAQRSITSRHPMGTSMHGRVVKSLVPVQREDQMDMLWSGEIAKFDTDKRQVFGWCSLSQIDGRDVVDLQGDYVPIDEMEKSAYRYVLESRKGGDMHKRVNKGLTTNWDEPVHTADLVESFVVTPEKLEKMGLPNDALPLGWWVGFKVNDDEQWNLVKSGGRAGFSIHGTGQRRPYESLAKRDDTKIKARASAVQRARSAAHPPPVKLKPVHSTALRAAGYQRQTRRLAVEMNSRPGQPYQYRVKPKPASQFLNSASLGRAYSQQIRGKAPRHTRFTVGDRARLALSPVTGTS